MIRDSLNELVKNAVLEFIFFQLNILNAFISIDNYIYRNSWVNINCRTHLPKNNFRSHVEQGYKHITGAQNMNVKIN